MRKTAIIVADQRCFKPRCIAGGFDQDGNRVAGEDGLVEDEPGRFGPFEALRS